MKELKENKNYLKLETYSSLKEVVLEGMAHDREVISGALLQDVQVVNATFSHCVFYACHFNRVRFLNCKFINCQFLFCHFEETFFYGCKHLKTAWSQECINGISFEMCQIVIDSRKYDLLDEKCNVKNCYYTSSDYSLVL